jgi:hypothetical protein
MVLASTDSDSSIGYATRPAQRSAEDANVVIADVLEQEGRALADELGDQAIWKATASSEKSL